MRSSARGPVRWVRAGVLTCAVVWLGCVAHMVGGQPPPSSRVLLLAAVVIGLESFLLARRRLPLPALVAATGVGQVALHLLFMGFAPPSMVMPGSTQMVGPHAAMTGAAGDGPLAAPSLVAHLGMTGPMLLAHAAATVVLAALLARGEAAVWWLWRRILPSRPRPAAPVIPRPGPAQICASSQRPSALHALLAGDPRRGPPGVPALAS